MYLSTEYTLNLGTSYIKKRKKMKINYQSQPLKQNWDRELPRYWFDNSPLKTHYMNAISIITPVSELAVIHALKETREFVKDPALKDQITIMIAQESWHSFSHKNYNVRGDELGGVEAYQRKIRRGEKILKPSFTISSDKKEVDGHDGRHRVLALQREGEKKIPVNVNAHNSARARELGVGVKDTERDDINTKYRDRKDLKDIKRQDPKEKLSEKDTRHPMLGRKKAIDRLKALIRKEGETNSGEAGHKKDTRKPEGDTPDNLLGCLLYTSDAADE